MVLGLASAFNSNNALDAIERAEFPVLAKRIVNDLSLPRDIT